MKCYASIALSHHQQTHKDGMVLSRADSLALSIEAFGSDYSQILQIKPRVWSEGFAS